jgi:hypothetical protein
MHDFPIKVGHNYTQKWKVVSKISSVELGNIAVHHQTKNLIFSIKLFPGKARQKEQILGTTRTIFTSYAVERFSRRKDEPRFTIYNLWLRKSEISNYM